MLTEFTQYNDLGLLALRLVVGAIFVYHAMPKLKAPEAMAGGVGMSANTVRVLGFVELLAGLGIALGVLFAWSALAIAVVMIGAIYYKISKWKVSFWSQTQTGWEFDLVLLAAAIFFLTSGAGSLALN